DGKVKSLDADAAELLEDAAYQTARAKLLAGDFDAVAQVAGESCSLGATSGRLTNLELQASRGLPAEDSLAEFGTLLAYGYDLDGFARGKALPVFDATTDKLLARTSDAVTQYPAEEQLLLNRAQLLLSLQRAEEARELFLRVLDRSPESPAAHLGAGLAAFELGDYQAAAEEFDRVLEINPDLVDAMVNRAITLDRMGRRAEATQAWREAATMTEDASLRAKIARLLEDR
ncbi:MAG: tetratricopeptide repeat protein, partial [Planctomycetales bacterium]|nr:tetratricopeptide repeat protein [Planctomycetales bacterium]